MWNYLKQACFQWPLEYRYQVSLPLAGGLFCDQTGKYNFFILLGLVWS
jgi:hypothetical protein